MTYLLDTNACIGWLRGNQPRVVSRLQQERPGDLLLCSIVVAELRYGVERSDPAHRANTALQVEQLRGQFMSLPFDNAAAEEYGRIRSHLAGQGISIGGNDLMIASIALANGQTLVTHNTAEFSRVPGLAIEDWEAP
ncbi:MAG TPA: type II toxin-antitoxin system VapC family toxin [Pirellulales bacterium]